MRYLIAIILLCLFATLIGPDIRDSWRIGRPYKSLTGGYGLDFSFDDKDGHHVRYLHLDLNGNFTRADYIVPPIKSRKLRTRCECCEFCTPGFNCCQGCKGGGNCSIGYEDN